MAIKKDYPLNILKGKTSPISEKMIGKKYGRLTVLSFLGVHETDSKNTIAMVSAVCECGTVHNYQSRHLRDGWTVSCGCFQAEFSSKRHLKHGQKSPKHGKRGTILYARWRSMFDRVRSDKRYKNVVISERWKGENGFVNFCTDMGEMPTPKHTVDRYPICNGDYTPENCRWATMKEQGQNTTRNVFHVYKGEKLCQSEIARRVGINPRELSRRIRNLKLTIDEAIAYMPTKNKRSKK